VPRDPDCLFCKIVAGEIPSTRIDENERTVSFMDVNPATRGHALVVPREHYLDLHEIPADELAAVMAAAQRVAGRLADGLPLPRTRHSALRRRSVAPPLASFARRRRRNRGRRR
jgi:diadenosine tetraphosphate (Ap4A) HIT family hydrolase